MTEPQILLRLTELAEEAASKNEVPIAAIITCDSKIIAEAHNHTEAHQSFFAHAELLAMQSASAQLASKYLNRCTLYVSLEPCQMCFAAAKLCRIQSIYYLLDSEKFGQKGQAYKEIECRKVSDTAAISKQLHLLQSFFKQRR